MTFLGVFLGLLYSFGGLIVDLLTVGLNWGTAMAFGALIIMPIGFGTVGFIWVAKERILKELGGKILTKKKKEKALDMLVGEVETYNTYLTGDVWNISITLDDEDIENCGGFYGYDYAEKEAESIIDYNILKEILE